MQFPQWLGDLGFLMRLPACQWHADQAFTGLVPVRIMLQLACIVTKNSRVSTGAHVLND